MFKNLLVRALSFLPSAVKEAPEKIKKALLTWQIKRSYLWRIKAEVDNFRGALEMARNPLRYDRKGLYAIYREVELDDQVISQRRIAEVQVQRAPFEVMKNGKADDALVECFQRPWFHDFLAAAVNTEFWGHSLVEFDPVRDATGHWQAFGVVPRDHVRPEYGDVVLNITDANGVSFRDAKKFPYLFEIGRPDDLGLYHIVAVPAIRKRYADTDWSLFSERFGSPFLTIKTATRDPKELDAKEKMAAEFGSNGYAILDDMDEINTVVTNHNGTAHVTFDRRMDRADDQIAKVMNGQTSTSDEKAYVGAAEVHERILGDFTFARLTWIQYMINFRLIPFMVGHGYTQLQDARFEFLELRKKEKEAGAAEAGKDPEEKPGAARQKKSLHMNAFSLHYDPYFHSTDCDCPSCQETLT